MSSWIYVHNLPNYFDELEIKEIFRDNGPIKQIVMKTDSLLLKSSSFVQFVHSKCAKQAAIRKDQTVIDKNAIRVFLIWCPSEQISTIKITNISSDMNHLQLQQMFEPFGTIVDTRIIQDINTNNNELHALVSFSKVEYALQATQEMNGSIISANSNLSVQLLNPDARNLKWKRDAFEFTSQQIPH